MLQAIGGNDALANAVATFAVRPGTHTTTVFLPDQELPDHFYLHVSGENETGVADFSAVGSAGILGERPARYVPFKVALYNEEETRLRQIAARITGASVLGVPPVYEWVYRPEMQFSLYDLEVNNIQKRAAGSLDSVSVINLTNPVIGTDSEVDIFFTLLESQFQELSPFEAGDELVLAIGEHEIAITPGASEQQFLDIPTGYFDLLNAEDYLTISFYQGNDSANVLWEFAFSTLDVDVDSDNNNGLGLPDRSAAEEVIENADGHPGKILVINRGDTDNDNVPDYADFDAGEGFAPMIIEISDDIDIATAKIKFTYEQSDPAIINVDNSINPPSYEPAAGYMRIWTKNGTQARNVSDVSAGGNFIRSGQEVSLLLFTLNANREILLYVELVREKGIWGGHNVRTEIIK